MDSKGVVVAIISDTMKKNKNWVYGLKREDEKLCIKEHWNSKSGGKVNLCTPLQLIPSHVTQVPFY